MEPGTGSVGGRHDGCQPTESRAHADEPRARRFLCSVLRLPRRLSAIHFGSASRRLCSPCQPCAPFPAARRWKASLARRMAASTLISSFAPPLSAGLPPPSTEGGSERPRDGRWRRRRSAHRPQWRCGSSSPTAARAGRSWRMRALESSAGAQGSAPASEGSAEARSASCADGSMAASSVAMVLVADAASKAPGEELLRHERRAKVRPRATRRADKHRRRVAQQQELRHVLGCLGGTVRAEPAKHHQARAR